MTTALAEACSDLEQWLPRAAALIPVPDTIAGAGTRTAPGSAPPWNSDAAMLVLEITAGLADAEQELRQMASGTVRDRAPYRQTGRALGAIPALAEAATGDETLRLAGRLEQWVTRIMTMPAIDAIEPERPVRVRRACPYCRLGDLRMMPRSFRVTCLRWTQCHDEDGQHPRGVFQQSELNGEWRIFWADGAVT